MEIYEADTPKSIILIARKNDPKGLALPGDFVDAGESVEDALRREMQIETIKPEGVAIVYISDLKD